MLIELIKIWKLAERDIVSVRWLFIAGTLTPGPPENSVEKHSFYEVLNKTNGHVKI